MVLLAVGQQDGESLRGGPSARPLRLLCACEITGKRSAVGAHEIFEGLRRLSAKALHHIGHGLEDPVLMVLGDGREVGDQECRHHEGRNIPGGAQLEDDVSVPQGPQPGAYTPSTPMVHLLTVADCTVLLLQRRLLSPGIVSSSRYAFSSWTPRGGLTACNASFRVFTRSANKARRQQYDENPETVSPSKNLSR